MLEGERGKNLTEKGTKDQYDKNNRLFAALKEQYKIIMDNNGNFILIKLMAGKL